MTDSNKLAGIATMATLQRTESTESRLLSARAFGSS